MKKKDEIKVCLVGSSGGHLTHLYMLKPFWKDKNRFWVTFDKEDARSLLEGEKVYPCYFPTNRSIKALIKNTKIAWDVLHKEKPDLIISCGAAVAVPFFYIGKMMGAKLVYIEVFDRIDKPTMTGKMVYRKSIAITPCTAELPMSFKVPDRLLTDGQCRMMINGIQFIQALLEANGLAAGKDHQFKGRYDAEKNAVIISLKNGE